MENKGPDQSAEVKNYGLRPPGPPIIPCHVTGSWSDEVRTSQEIGCRIAESVLTAGSENRVFVTGLDPHVELTALSDFLVLLCSENPHCLPPVSEAANTENALAWQHLADRILAGTSNNRSMSEEAAKASSVLRVQLQRFGPEELLIAMKTIIPQISDHVEVSRWLHRFAHCTQE